MNSPVRVFCLYPVKPTIFKDEDGNLRYTPGKPEGLVKMTRAMRQAQNWCMLMSLEADRGFRG